MGKMKRSCWLAGVGLCCLAILGALLLKNARHDGTLQNALLTASEYTPKLHLWPLDGLDIATFLICATCLSLAGGAGIGGGAVLVPCFILVRGWPTSIAVAMSNVTVLGGSFANFICNVTRRRANGHRTIDWELILMMEPTTIAGAILGAILNKLLPNWLTTYLLTCFISFMAIRLYQKGRQAYDKETALLKSAKHAAKAAAKAEAAAASAVAAVDAEEQQQPQTVYEDDHRLNRGVSIKVRKISRGFNDRNLSASFRESLGRSFTALNAPLLTDTSRSYTTPTAAAATAAAAAAARNPQGLRQASQGAAVGSWQPGSLREGSQRKLLDLLSTATLCQGDGDDIEPIVAVRLVSELSSSSSTSSEDQETAAAAASDHDQDHKDLELGFNDHADPDHDLRQPLLPADHAAAAPAGEQDAAAAAAAASSNGYDLPRVAYSRDQNSPDGVVVVDEWSNKSISREGAPSGTFPLTPKASPHSEPHLPLPHFFTLIFLSAWVVASDIAKSSTVCGSWQYWAITLSVLGPVVIILLTFRQILLRKYRHDDLAPGTILPDGQLHWNRTTTLLYPTLCSSAGLIAGLFGIGGGVVKGPLMLELGVPPDVAAATSATMIMFTAASACVVYSRFGQLLVDYAIAMIIIGFFVTLGSQLLTFILIKLLGRRSVIIFMMVVLMSMACSIMLLESVQETLKLIAHPEELRHFGRLCPPSKGGVGCFLARLAGQHLF